MSDWNEDKQKRYDEAIGALRSLDVSPSPFLKTRVLANVRNKQYKRSKRLRYLQMLVLACASGAFAIAMYINVGHLVAPTPEMTIVELGKPYMVKAEIGELASLDPSYVRIELGGGVQFSSNKHNHIRQMRELTLSWERLAGKQHLPVVIQGVESGASSVTIQVFDKDGRVIKTHNYQLDFKQRSS